MPYLAHNSQGRAVRLDEKLQTGFELCQTQIGSDYMACIVDKDIEPSVDQQGLVFNLNDLYYPAWAVGHHNVNDQMGKHLNKQPYDQPINIVKSTEILKPSKDGASQITCGTFLIMASFLAATVDMF